MEPGRYVFPGERETLCARKAFRQGVEDFSSQPPLMAFMLVEMTFFYKQGKIKK